MSHNEGTWKDLETKVVTIQREDVRSVGKKPLIVELVSGDTYKIMFGSIFIRWWMNPGSDEIDIEVVL